MSIPINYIKPPMSAIGVLLKGCYFMPDTGAKYKFYDQANNQLATNIQSGTSFSVLDFKGFDWTLVATFKTVAGITDVSGTWKAKTHVAPIPPPFAEEEGTFASAAGGSSEPEPGDEDEAASSASATA